MKYCKCCGQPIPEKDSKKKELILQEVCDYFELSKREIRQRTRQRKIVIARQVSHYFLHKKTDMTLSEIGLFVGLNDHATVIYSIKTVKNLMQTDKAIRGKVEAIKKRID